MCDEVDERYMESEYAKTVSEEFFEHNPLRKIKWTTDKKKCGVL